MLDNMKIAEFIAEKRKQKAMTQQQVADVLNVSFQAVSKWETGAAYPDIEKLKDLSQLLGVTVDELLDGRETGKDRENNRQAAAKNAVLIVDDAAIMRMMLRDILGKNEFGTVIEAENGKRAVEIFNRGIEFEYVLMDINMPEMHGIAAMKLFHKNHKSRIVMLSARSYPGMVLESIEAGAEYFVAKPFSHDTLIEGMKNKSRKYDKEDLPLYKEYLTGKYGDFNNNTEIMPQSELDALLLL